MCSETRCAAARLPVLSTWTRELAAFARYFGSADCAIAVTVTSFSRTTLEGTWTTNESRQAPAVDQGTLTLTRQ